VSQCIQPSSRDGDWCRSVHATLPDATHPTVRHPNIEIGPAVVAVEESRDDVHAWIRAHVPLLLPRGEMDRGERFHGPRVVSPQ